MAVGREIVAPLNGCPAAYHPASFLRRARSAGPRWRDEALARRNRRFRISFIETEVLFEKEEQLILWETRQRHVREHMILGIVVVITYKRTHSLRSLRGTLMCTLHTAMYEAATRALNPSKRRKRKIVASSAAPSSRNDRRASAASMASGAPSGMHLVLDAKPFRASRSTPPKQGASRKNS